MRTDAQWNAALYAGNTAHHRAYDDHILGPLTIEERFAVLDLGSGAGDLTAKLAAAVPTGSVVGIDASLPLIESSRTRFSAADNVGFVHLRAQDLDQLEALTLGDGRVTGPPFDLILTVATLHWVPSAAHPELYSRLFDLLVEGGRFRADFGGAGQIAQVREILDEESSALGGTTSPWYFPTAEAVETQLLAAGFELTGGFVRLVTQRRSVPDLNALIGWLDSQVLIAYQPSLDGAAYPIFRERAIQRLREVGPRPDGTFDQDYVRVDLLVTKPAS
jgi:trans-aconitate methyltransferase